MHVHVYVYVDVRVHVYVYVHVYLHAGVCECVWCMCLCVCVCICMCMCMLVRCMSELLASFQAWAEGMKRKRHWSRHAFRDTPKAQYTFKSVLVLVILLCARLITLRCALHNLHICRLRLCFIYFCRSSLMTLLIFWHPHGWTSLSLIHKAGNVRLLRQRGFAANFDAQAQWRTGIKCQVGGPGNCGRSTNSQTIASIEIFQCLTCLTRQTCKIPRCLTYLTYSI